MSNMEEAVTEKRPEATTRDRLTVVAKQSLMVGAGSAPPALIVGSVLGAFRSSHPTAFALAFTIQWFTFGTAFWATRSFLNSPPIYTLHPLALEPYPKAASTISAGLSGALVGLIARGRRSVVPGAVTFSILGYLGHTAFSAFEAKQLSLRSSKTSRDKTLATNDGGVPNNEGDRNTENLLQRLARSKWSPMTVVSDAEHRRILLRHKEGIEDEIKGIDREIENLRVEDRKRVLSDKAQKS